MTLDELRRAAELLPEGTSLTLPRDSLLAALASTMPEPAPESPAATWRERLWTCPPETRLGVVELVEAIGRPKSWIYRHTSAKSGLELLPHRLLEGALVFTASDIREWVTVHEEWVIASRRLVVPIVRRAQERG
jgi:predicted DNA-binding transcriptional regulator AlpA